MDLSQKVVQFEFGFMKDVAFRCYLSAQMKFYHSLFAEEKRINPSKRFGDFLASYIENGGAQAFASAYKEKYMPSDVIYHEKY